MYRHGEGSVKTLPEILTGVVHIEAKENTDCYVDPTCVAVFDKPKVEQAIAKELMGCLPEKLEIPDNWRVLRPELVDQYEAHNSVVDEVRARLTAFIGHKEK